MRLDAVSGASEVRKRIHGASARPERDGARHGQKIFQQKNTFGRCEYMEHYKTLNVSSAKGEECTVPVRKQTREGKK